MSAALGAVAAAVRAEGGLLAGALVEPPAPGDGGLGTLAAGGPRAAGREAELAEVVEAVREGHLLHHGRARVLSQDDPDLALLAGDRLYALGLERLAAAGDVVSVRALADVIALAAQAAAAGDEDLSAAVWEAGATEVGWGPGPGLDEAKELARAGDPGAAAALRAAARHAREDLAPNRPRTGTPGPDGS
ncbi:hypothetical protein [Conexibacter sp. SYSU D00693]|uniref:hypothetical protein n=1 Tax=Conexibacter sp. SYSU D00693 TaxID=2812560 RepID=UPI00196B7969|nr:hypothetical protein [Conexibacter sp. SYSU D00693]